MRPDWRNWRAAADEFPKEFSRFAVASSAKSRPGVASLSDRWNAAATTFDRGSVICKAARRLAQNRGANPANASYRQRAFQKRNHARG